MPAEGRENPLLKKGNSDAFFREKYLTKNTYFVSISCKNFLTWGQDIIYHTDEYIQAIEEAMWEFNVSQCPDISNKEF